MWKTKYLFFFFQNKFFGIELEDGHAVLKFNLGSGTVVLKSPEVYNDGEWHYLEATREEDEGILKVSSNHSLFKEIPYGIYHQLFLTILGN